MPFVQELPARTRKGSSKYADALMKMVKSPGKYYQFEEELDNPSGTAVMLKNSKFTQELSEEYNGTFSFNAIGGELFGWFTPNKRTAKKRKK